MEHLMHLLENSGSTYQLVENCEERLKAAGFEVGPEMMAMMGGFTVLRLFTLMGGMADVKFTKEELLALNKKLNRIRQPKN